MARDPGVAAVAKVKLLVEGGTLVFGFDPSEFAYRRLVVVDGVRGPAMAGDHSRKHVGEVVRARRPARSGSPASTTPGDRFEDLGIVLPLHTVEALAKRPGEVTSIGVNVKLGQNVKHGRDAARARATPGIAAITEPGQAIKVDTSSRLIISTGWIVSHPRADRRRDRRHEHDGDVGLRADARDRDPARGRLARRAGSAR